MSFVELCASPASVVGGETGLAQVWERDVVPVTRNGSDRARSDLLVAGTAVSSILKLDSWKLKPTLSPSVGLLAVSEGDSYTDM